MKTKQPMVPIGYIQFIASLLVILVHCGRLAENSGLHFLLKSLLCRLAVPFFLLLNGYFFQKSTRSWQQWCKRQLKLYLRWSIVYLPLGGFYLGQQNLADSLRVIGLATGFFTVGVWYHLWYFPALLFGMWLVRKTRFLGYRRQFLLAISLYVIGCLETYSSYLSGPLLVCYQSYRTLFFTTRNGLFYGFLFLLCGVCLREHQKHPFFTKHLGRKLAVSLCLLGIEGRLVYLNQGDDKNFMLFFVPTTLFFLAWLIKQQPPKRTWQAKQAAEASRLIFLSHPLFLETGKVFFSLAGFPLFFYTIALTGAFLGLRKVGSRLKSYTVGFAKKTVDEKKSV